MQFIKKHYEKIILSIVLLGLAVASALLPIKVGETQEQLNEDLVIPREKPYAPVDFSTNRVAVERLDKPLELELDGVHNLFNPVRWKKQDDGTLIKDTLGNLGPKAVVIESIEPLHLTIAYEGVAGTPDRRRYEFDVTQEGAERASDRRGRQRSLEVGRKNDVFILKEIKGSPETPSELVIELITGNVTASVFPGKPFRIIQGYMADLRYPPENKVKPKARVGESWSFGGDKYNIVAIDADEVTFSAESTSKRTTIEWKKQGQ